MLGTLLRPDIAQPRHCFEPTAIFMPSADKLIHFYALQRQILTIYCLAPTNFAIFMPSADKFYHFHAQHRQIQPLSCLALTNSAIFMSSTDKFCHFHALYRQILPFLCLGPINFANSMPHINKVLFLLIQVKKYNFKNQTC